MILRKETTMPNPKLENLLNLALETSEAEREKSLNLNVGYEQSTNSWEVIVKYNGDLTRLEQSGIIVERLIAGYAILMVPEPLLDSLAELEEIEYVEKPKRLYFDIEDAKAVSCIPQVTVRPPFLSGEGCVIAVLDSGIEYQNPVFRNADESSRILFLWDQTVEPDAERGFFSPEGFALGTEFTKAQIDAALRAENEAETFRLVPSRDTSGHGTAVAGIAAGNSSGGRKGAGTGGERNVGIGRESYTGVAPRSNLIIVKLGIPGERGFPRTTELMRGLLYVARKAAELRLPVAVNLSFGNTYGAHDGNSLLERYIDNITEIGRSVICVGSGNEGASAGHLAGSLRGRGTRAITPGVTSPSENAQTVELAVAQYETSLNVQLWKNYVDRFRVILYSPGGRRFEVPVETLGKEDVILEDTRVLIYVGEPRPYSVSQEIYFDLIPRETYINQGIWRFELIPQEIVTGDFYFYLPSAVTRNAGTGFFAPTPDVTLTIPSTSRKVLTVGAYNSTYNAYADFSGRGYGGISRVAGAVEAGMVKPDLVAPGVDILAPDLFGGFTAVTGTSFATPIVTGAAALMMEWGIVQGNDPFLYGEKVKAYLRRGARHLPGYEYFPNAQVGYGKLCVAESIPRG